MKTTPRSYTMKGSNLPQVGFIAQELKPLIPEVVDGTDGSMGISYGNLVAVAFQAIKELNQKVTDLTTKVDSIQESLKNMVFDRFTAKIAYIDQIDVKKLNAVDANFSGVVTNEGVVVNNNTVQFKKDARFDGNICVDNVCITKDQLKTILLQGGGATYGTAADQMKGVNPLDVQTTPVVTTPVATTTDIVASSTPETTQTIETVQATTTPMITPVIETTPTPTVSTSTTSTTEATVIVPVISSPTEMATSTAN
ncbi:MAG: hypothetical protein NT077_04710, partial [Candidatus Taylorbacteria bacterium]|nr:hypothetical protein [Candidatus Taylorbacteria bacterium]